MAIRKLDRTEWGYKKRMLKVEWAQVRMAGDARARSEARHARCCNLCAPGMAWPADE